MKNKDSLIETICSNTGISRRDLAILTDGNQSTISRYQKGERSLPTQPLIQMSKLLVLLNSLPSAPKIAPLENDKKELLERAVWCRAKCHPLQKKLQEMETIEKQATITLQMMDSLLADVNINDKKKNWAEVIKLAAKKKLRKNSWLAQRELFIQIELLLKEAEMCESVNT